MASAVFQVAEALKRALSSSGASLPADQPGLAVAIPISPWAIWVLFSLVRHERRQQWVAEVASNILGADLDAISAAGYSGHPPIERRGLVPGMSDWEYDFHGRGCCLTNRISGESIDVDFYDGSAEWFDDFFFMNFLKSLKKPPFVEGRVILLHPALETIRLSFDELLDLELLERRTDSKVVRLSPACREWAAAIDQLDANCSQADRGVDVGMALGDWFLARDHPDANPVVHSQAQLCSDARHARLSRLFDEPERRSQALLALNDLGIRESRLALESAFQDSPSGAVSEALEIVLSRNTEEWTDEVVRLLRRTNQNGDIPEPHIWLGCAEYLLRRGHHRDEISRGLSRMDQRELGDAAILALEFMPEHALSLFRKALRSGVPNDRTTAAAALSIIDEPWSRAELVSVLQETDDQVATAECRAALSSLRHGDLHEIVRQWDLRNPHEPEVGPFISMAEMALLSREAYLQYEMEVLHDRILPLRGKLVP